MVICELLDDGGYAASDSQMTINERVCSLRGEVFDPRLFSVPFINFKKLMKQFVFETNSKITSNQDRMLKSQSVAPTQVITTNRRLQKLMKQK